MSDEKKGSRLVSVDMLRGIAVLLVLGRHLPFSTATAPGVEAASAIPLWGMELARYGEYGVHLFLVISGFCIHMAWARQKDEETVRFGSFWKRRLHRLYPPYFVALLMSVAGLYLFHAVLGGKTDSWAARFGYSDLGTLVVDLLLLVLLAQNLNGASARIGNGPFWSLALEEQLYMLYFPLLWLRKNVSWTAALAVSCVVSTAWRLSGVVLFDSAPVFWWVVGPAHWFEWALGAYAVEASLKRVPLYPLARSFWFGIGLLVLGVLLDPPKSLGLHVPIGVALVDVVFGLAFFVLINAAWHAEQTGKLGSGVWARTLAKVGIWSYSIYLTHCLVIVGAKVIALKLGMGVIPTLIVRAATAMAFGYAFYRMVEVRFINRSRQKAITASCGLPNSGWLQFSDRAHRKRPMPGA